MFLPLELRRATDLNQYSEDLQQSNTAFAFCKYDTEDIWHWIQYKGSLWSDRRDYSLNVVWFHQAEVFCPQFTPASAVLVRI